jgi:putative addiction module killer protein
MQIYVLLRAIECCLQATHRLGSSVRFEVYKSSEGRVPYLDWFSGLDSTLRRAAQRRLRAIEDNDHFGKRKNLRGGLHELKFRQVVRIYFAEIDGQIVLLLGGSGKRNQGREIAKARARLKDFEQRTE